jgi:PmbA protein
MNEQTLAESGLAQIDKEKNLARKTLARILAHGFDKAATRVSADELHELQAENGEINLLRTNFETEVGLVGIADGRRASLSINQVDDAAINTAVSDLQGMAAGSQQDPAFDIAAMQPPAEFRGGIDQPDYDAMYDRIQALQTYVAATYPTLNLRSSGITFFKRRSCFVNSNGVEFVTSRGLYQVSVSFSSRLGSKTSSMMYTGYSTLELDTPIHLASNVDLLMRQSTEQIETQHIPAKFVGDMVITPDCLMTFVGFLTARISDGPLVSGTSMYKGKLGEHVASPLLTLHSRPLSEELCGGYWVTGDGYQAANTTVIDQGVLKTYLLGLYGANKTGLPRAVNSGGSYIAEPGDVTFDEMVAGVKEGILITRFSGGRPNDRGDFSGIAKNSYYIKDGKVQFPIKETTVSGNMVDLLNTIDAVSTERLNTGGSLLPWVRVTGVSAS